MYYGLLIWPLDINSLITHSQPNSQGPLAKLPNRIILTVQYTELLSNHISKNQGDGLFCFCLQSSNHNEIIQQQSLHFAKNQLEQTTESQLTIYKGVLHSKELIYTVYLQCTAGFFVTCPIFCCCACVSVLVSIMPCLGDKAADCRFYLLV